MRHGGYDECRCCDIAATEMQDLKDDIAATREEIKRLRAYLPLARLAWNQHRVHHNASDSVCTCSFCMESRALTPEQRAWLMEDK